MEGKRISHALFYLSTGHNGQCWTEVGAAAQGWAILFCFPRSKAWSYMGTGATETWTMTLSLFFFQNLCIYEREREIVHLLAFFPNDCSSQGWVRRKLRAENSICVSHRGGRSPQIRLFYCLCRCTIRELIWKQRSQDANQCSHMVCQQYKQWLN